MTMNVMQERCLGYKISRQEEPGDPAPCLLLSATPNVYLLGLLGGGIGMGTSQFLQKVKEAKIPTQLTQNPREIQRGRNGAVGSSVAPSVTGKAQVASAGLRARTSERRIPSACSTLSAQWREAPPMARHPGEPPATAGPQGRSPVAPARAQAGGVAAACTCG